MTTTTTTTYRLVHKATGQQFTTQYWVNPNDAQKWLEKFAQGQAKGYCIGNYTAYHGMSWTEVVASIEVQKVPTA
jgi:hypothetical protein